MALLLAATAARAADPQTALREFLAHPALAGARVGVLVEDLEDGSVVAAHHAREPLVPASNQKLVTSVAALELWGPAHRFETPVRAGGALLDGTLDGPLWVVGAGDPGLDSEGLWKLAEELRLAGLREVGGGIAFDPGFFGDAGHHPDWHPVSQRAYHAPTAAFAANYSSFRIEVVPDARAGAPARLDLAPLVDYFRPVAAARTVDGRGRLILDIAPLADASGERVRISGSVARDGEADTYWRSVALPGRYAASVLRAQLEAQGIRVRGGVRSGAVPAGAAELLRFQGAPVAEHVRRLNKYSNNFVAEQLVKLAGARAEGGPATWAKGTRAIEAWLRDTGLAVPGTRVADGSGLSPRNRISPATLVGLLRRAISDPRHGPELLTSLPLGGLDGTLEDRKLETVPGLRAKTGHLRAVSALSGVMRGADGRSLAFSVLVNGARGHRTAVDDAMDALVRRLAGAPDPPRDDVASSRASTLRR